MTHQEIREKFINFFKEKKHIPVPSSSLLPSDPSVLFTTAGMQPMIPYLLGEKHPLGNRIVDSQKCFRADDIEEVGDNRHTTFFEMLGNWSFGDYFKKEQLSWIFEFLTKEINLDPKKLYVTVFAGDEVASRDEETAQIWKGLFESVGLDFQDHIFYYDETKNWWSRNGKKKNMPPGEVGGPDSEIFYDFGTEHNKQYGEKCHPNCDCGRFIEIGNNVFIEYKKNKSGSFDLLPQKNVDFGGGLERITAASENQPDIFLTSALKPIVEELEKITGKKYHDYQKAFRIMAEHTKATVFLIADGARPSNKAQGYVVRRLIRRVIRFGSQFDINQKIPLLLALVNTVIEMYEKDYPELKENKEIIIKELRQEEERFAKTLEKGNKKISEYKILDSKIAFDLYQSYGFPFELTEEIARERGQKVEYGEFRKAFEEHQAKSRAGAEKKFGGHGLVLNTGELKAATEEEVKIVTRLHTATHLLHAALRKILGEEVRQAGSDITAERLRFDFTFPRKFTPEEIKRVEDLVNKVIGQDLPVTKEEMPYEEVLKTDALSFFKQKYPDRVNVYSVGDFSKELCGGPHVSRTSEIGQFKITKEEAIAAGVRRIRAIIQ